MGAKTRCDAKLKTLPEERQDQIIEKLRREGLSKTRKWLAADGLLTSNRALSEFRSWYLLQEQLREADSVAQSFMDRLQQDQPNLTNEQLYTQGQRVFELLAIQQASAKDWSRVQSVALRRERLRFDREKFRESIKTNIDRGLDALKEEIAGDQRALSIYEQLRSVVMSRVEGAE